MAALASDTALLSHLQALALEGSLADRLEAAGLYLHSWRRRPWPWPPVLIASGYPLDDRRPRDPIGRVARDYGALLPVVSGAPFGG